jgi:hypothetical protein
MTQAIPVLNDLFPPWPNPTGECSAYWKQNSAQTAEAVGGTKEDI